MMNSNGEIIDQSKGMNVALDYLISRVGSKLWLAGSGVFLIIIIITLGQIQVEETRRNIASVSLTESN